MKSKEFKVSVFGLGYLGLTIAACIASRNILVYGYDIDKEKLIAIENGEFDIYEDELNKLIADSLKKKSLKITDNHVEAILNTDITFVIVGTPTLEDFKIDLSQIIIASEMIGKALKKKREWHLIAIKSTVPPGTTENIVKPILEEVSGKKLGDEFGLVSNPEFMAEGKAVRDILQPTRIVIGELDKESGGRLIEFYKMFYGENIPPIIRTTSVNSELIKYASNNYLAGKLSFINYIARICEILPGCDINTVAEGMGLDPRIGKHYLRAGIGFGGSCLPKDLKGMIKFSEEFGLDPVILKAILDINENQPAHAVDLLHKNIGELKNKKIAVLGLAFKAGTDDVRESPAVKLVEELLERGAIIRVYDPVAINRGRELLGNKILYFEDPYKAVEDADVLVIATEWPQFKDLDFNRIRKIMKGNIVFDCKRIISKDKLISIGLKYIGVGLGNSSENS